MMRVLKYTKTDTKRPYLHIMKRIILNIDEDVDDVTALEAALSVVKMGKISKTSRGEQYCFHSVTANDVDIAVTKQKSGTESFFIYYGTI
jgi:hypothetical protein